MEDLLKTMKVPTPLADRLKEAAALIDNCHGTIRIISHYDGDGICSAGIVSRALSRCGHRFHATMADVMKKEDYKGLPGGFELLIVSDMGSAQAIEVSEKVRDLGIKGIILDHHKAENREEPFNPQDGSSVIEINPRFHGINGTTGASGSTISFLLAVALSDTNCDLAVYSLAGAIADRQHVPEFSELNLSIRNLAIERGFIKGFKGMPLHGKDIEEALVTTNDPFINGISGNRVGVRALLAKLRIDFTKRMEDLDENEIKVLNSFVHIHLLNEGVEPAVVSELFRENLFTPEWGSLNDLAYVIDSCGRMRQAGLGFEVVWGSKEAYGKAHGIRMDTKRRIQELLLKKMAGGVHTMENIEWMEVDEDPLAGTVAGIAHNYIFDHMKPMIAISRPDAGSIKFKVSSRGNRRLCDKGLDLGAVMREASAMYGGEGGGHDVAAGGSFQEGNMEGFLSMCNQMVGEQLKGKVERNAK